MTTFFSTQETTRQAGGLLNISDFGPLERRFFEFVVPTATIAVSDDIEALLMPANYRFMGGEVFWDAMSTAGGTAKLQVGTRTVADETDDPDHYLGSTDVDAAGTARFGVTLALNWGELFTEDTYLLLTNPNDTSEAWAAAADIKGFVDLLPAG